MENNGIKTLEEVSSFNDLNLHESFRAHMLYEEVSGESFKPTNLKSILIFFYATIMACNREFASDFDTFVDWLDGHPSYVEDFMEWLTGQLKRKVVKETTDTEAEGKEPPFHH
jgi:hypothetical protein